MDSLQQAQDWEQLSWISRHAWNSWIYTYLYLVVTPQDLVQFPPRAVSLLEDLQGDYLPADSRADWAADSQADWAGDLQADSKVGLRVNVRANLRELSEVNLAADLKVALETCPRVDPVKIRAENWSQLNLNRREEDPMPAELHFQKAIPRSWRTRQTSPSYCVQGCRIVLFSRACLWLT